MASDVPIVNVTMYGDSGPGSGAGAGSGVTSGVGAGSGVAPGVGVAAGDVGSGIVSGAVALGVGSGAGAGSAPKEAIGANIEPTMSATWKNANARRRNDEPTARDIRFHPQWDEQVPARRCAPGRYAAGSRGPTKRDEQGVEMIAARRGWSSGRLFDYAVIVGLLARSTSTYGGSW